ncbi:hydantoinase B/oxoprolinase family protein [Pseudoroseomonas wenyumeiae]|uniref:Hydantoinase B/oxoprolinase family protein n=1 Tax=Teichococcus wenyumeiae TaxID=2478470 RepID=A0A3A9JPD5_9PROT|nr:hydantoinase B/oxoprolinase family protein [Pseudoroseomonas wenyumeiae]RKK05694.1 hydantoinase B/oxoprolinase family protein [Pseudoroseomonas wenyumeiae]RMI25995.1 hydantoinase B/oxoprolinase family protein [Pseudoroseomonas wenyumeiae]
MSHAIAEAKPAALDPITVEVIGAALSSIVEETGEALIRASYSTNIKERRDCSTALFNAAGETLCQAEHIPIHLGSFIGIIPQIMRKHRVEDMRPGDVFVGNDAYEGGGTHLPDIVLAEPIFFENRIVAWTVNLAHHSDFADRGHAHIYQEGLRIPPVRLYREGVLQEDVQNLILLNCQVPHERLSDLRAQMAANRVGVQRFQALCAKYGVETVLGAAAELLNYAERKMRAGIAALPDGSWIFKDVFDPIDIPDSMPFAVKVTIRGDSMSLDFDAPDQRRAGINMTYTALLATVYYIVKSVVDPTILPNAGLARPLTVTARKGSILNCEHPAAVNGRLAACQRVSDLILGAISQAAPERVTACSNSICTVASFIGQRKEDGALWVYLETMGGGNGARHNKDGLDGVHVHTTNTSNLPVEALEIEYPLTLLRYELVQDSGGTGRFRGGMGLRRVYRADEDCLVRVDIGRLRSRSWGLQGGGAGSNGAVECGPGVTFNGSTAALKAGQWFAIVSPGAGAYGPPQQRPAEAVARDVAEGVISAAHAKDAYGFNA